MKQFISWFISSAILIGTIIFIGSIFNRLGAKSDNSGIQLFFIIVIISLALIVCFFLFQKVYNVKEKFREELVKNQITQFIKQDLHIYQETKKSVKYLSDETLNKKYNNLKVAKGINRMVILAIEEELVERKIIPFSPEHEKMEAAKDFFNQA